MGRHLLGQWHGSEASESTTEGSKTRLQLRSLKQVPYADQTYNGLISYGIRIAAVDLQQLLNPP